MARIRGDAVYGFAFPIQRQGTVILVFHPKIPVEAEFQVAGFFFPAIGQVNSFLHPGNLS